MRSGSMQKVEGGSQPKAENRTQDWMGLCPSMAAGYSSSAPEKRRERYWGGKQNNKKRGAASVGAQLSLLRSNDRESYGPRRVKRREENKGAKSTIGGETSLKEK